MLGRTVSSNTTRLTTHYLLYAGGHQFGSPLGLFNVDLLLPESFVTGPLGEGLYALNNDSFGRSAAAAAGTMRLSSTWSRNREMSCRNPRRWSWAAWLCLVWPDAAGVDSDAFRWPRPRVAKEGLAGAAIERLVVDGLAASI